MIFIRICIFIVLIIFSFNTASAKEEKEFNIDSKLYSYFQKCQENLNDSVVLSMSDSLFIMAKEYNDQRMQAVALILKLDYYYYKGDEGKITYYVEKVKDFASQTNQWKYYYFVWSDRLILYYLKTGNVNIALYQAQEMLKYAQRQDNKEGLLSCYNSLFQIYNIKDLKNLSNEYCLKAIELTENYKLDNYNIAIFYAEAARSFIDQGKPDLALKYLKKGDESVNAELHHLVVRMYYMRYYLEIGDLTKAGHVMRECQDLFKNNKKIAAHKKILYENEYYYYKNTGQYQNALTAADRQIEEENRLSEYIQLGSHYKKKADVYLAMGRKDLAANYFDKYIQLEDSLKLNNEELTTGGYATLVNLEKVEREKKELLLKTQEKELRNKQIIIFSLLLLLLILFFFFYRESKLNKCLTNSEEELRKAKDKAEVASKVKTRFIQSMSHEIRTPLNSIVGFSQILGSKYQDDVEAKEYANIIETNSNHLLRLISHVLELSDLDKYDAIDTSYVTDINNCCKVSLQSVQNSLKPDVELLFKPSCEELIVHSNPERVMQVLANLLHNATKFTKQGTITLSYLYSETDKRIYFSIADTGCGIPLDKQSEVFERFTKLDSYSQGSGLGLSISKEIAERMGGDLYIDSEYTKGSCFIFVIPYN